MRMDAGAATSAPRTSISSTSLWRTRLSKDTSRSSITQLTRWIQISWPNQFKENRHKSYVPTLWTYLHHQSSLTNQASANSPASARHASLDVHSDPLQGGLLQHECGTTPQQWQWWRWPQWMPQTPGIWNYGSTSTPKWPQRRQPLLRRRQIKWRIWSDNSRSGSPQQPQILQWMGSWLLWSAFLEHPEATE